MKVRATVLSIAALLSANTMVAQAQDQTYDTRSLALGGTGVAIANTRNAAFLNPSILASKDADSFAWDIPIISARLLDEKDMLTDMDSLTTAADSLNVALTNFSANPVASTATVAAPALAKFNTALAGINGKTLNVGAFVGTMLGIPSKTFSFALVIDGHAEAGAKFNYAAADSLLMGTLTTDLTNCAGGNATSCTNASASVGANGSVTGLQSSTDIRGVVAKEVGISMAHHFTDWADTDIGITPKFIQLQTLDAKFNAQSTNNSISQDKDTTSESVFNLDLGASKSFKKTEDDEVKVGFVVKDMLSRSVKTVLNNDVEIKPRATVGVGYLTKLTSTGIDLDIVSNKPMISGFSSESQFLRLGAEFDAWNWMQIRVGYRHDLKGNYKGLPSVGLGLSPFGVHLDLSVAYASQSEAAASLQFGMHF